MCGIAGIVNLKQTTPCLLAVLKRMVGIMHYRGPDESGVYIDDWAGIGHNRLSIIDLTGGSQPLSNEDGTLWVVYNGEIYNYRELRRELEARGHRFKTASDTEVIVHAYEEKGEACLADFNGQFAFALWDAKKKELFLARDRVGVRPVHYTVHNDRFYFSSEIKSIFMAPDIPREINPIGLDQVFTFWTTLPGQTVFKGVHELLPGHWLKITQGNITSKKYWDIPLYPIKDHLNNESPQQIAEQIRSLLVDSVRLRLRADVPVGTYLSGGLDSSGVSALVAHELGSNIHTFGIRFEEDAFDEGPFQNEMASFLKTSHHELSATNERIGEAFSDVIWHCEKPILRTAPVPLYLLSNLVHDSGIKVVLTGEASDEFFCGYDIFKEAKIRRFWSRQPQSEIRPLLIGKLYPDIFKNSVLKKTLPAFFSKNMQSVGDPLYSHRIRWDNMSRCRQFYSDSLKNTIDGYDGFRELTETLPRGFVQLDSVSQSQYLEIDIFLSNYLLSSQGDRVAMAHSVEIRLPFLDHRLLEFAGRIPPLWKILGMNEKHILKKAFKGILPDRIVSRVKHPYRAPVHRSLLHTKSGERHRALLDEKSINRFGLFNSALVSRLVKKLEADAASEVDGMALTGILSTQLLAQQFIEQFPALHIKNPVLNVFIDNRSSSDRTE